MMYIKQVLAVIFTALIVASMATSQTEPQRRIRYPTILSDFSFRSWNMEEAGSESNLTEIITPITIHYPVIRSFTLTMATTGMLSSLDAGTKSSLNGIADIQVRGFYKTAGDHIFISVGLNLPGGRNSLSKDELELSRALSNSVLAFERNRLGGGFDIDVSGGSAAAFGPLVIGGGVGYLIKGKYEFQENSESQYKPGNELNLTAGADLDMGRLMLRTDVIYSIYSPNQMDGNDAFSEGSKLSAEGMLYFSAGPMTLLVSAREILRDKVAYQSPVSFLVGEAEGNIGNQLSFDGVIYLRAGSRLVLKAISEARFVGEAEDGAEEAFMAGFGGGLMIMPLRGMVMDLTGQYLTGHAQGGSIGLSGYGATASLKWEF